MNYPLPIIQQIDAMIQPNTPNKKILVVEDELVLGKLCVRMLTSEGYIADLAANGLIAKDMVKNNTYDICVSDIRTPEMNGMELYQFLQEKYPVLAKNTLFMTGDVMNKAIHAFIEKHKVPYISKPFTKNELITAISELSQ